MNTATVANSMVVAETIRAQIGNMAFTLLGASALAGDHNSLQFSIKGCKRINKIRIELNALDTYTVHFYKYNRSTFECPEVSCVDFVYADNLHSVIESETGLYCRF